MADNEATLKEMPCMAADKESTYTGKKMLYAGHKVLTLGRRYLI